MVMKIKQRILHTLGIKSKEKKTVLLSSILAFLVGSAQCYLSAVPMSLFLTRFSSANLPQVYLVVAVMAIAIGSIYTFFENRLLFNRLILGFILVIGWVTVCLWFLLAYFNTLWIIALLTIWAIVAYDLLDLGLWSVFNRIYNLQQAKQLYGMIGANQSIGGILSGLLLPVLLFFVSTEHVILLIGLLIFTALAVLILLLKNQKNLSDEKNAQELIDEGHYTLSQIFHNKYILKLMCMVILGVFAMYIIDILFNTVAEAHYPDQKILASFLGIFFGIVDGLDLLLSSLIFTRLLKHYGIIFSMLILPGLGIVISAFVLIFHAIPSFIILIFWLVVLLKLFEEAIRASISEMSNLLLLQPLSPGLRTYVLTKSDIFFVPLATAIISLILMGITSTWGIVIPWLIFTVLIFFGLYVLITLTLKADYIKVLTKAIAQRYVMTFELQSIDKESLPFFRKVLYSNHPDKVIYALSTIERIDKDEFLKELNTVFHSKKQEIRRFVLEKIRHYRIQSFFPQLLSSLDNEPSNSLKALIIKTLAALNYPQARTKIKNLAYDSSPSVYCAALITICRYGDSRAKKEALKKVNEMLHSDNEKFRKSAAFIIGEINDQNANQFLLELLLDDAPAVKQEVLIAAIKTKQVEAFKELLKYLDILHLNAEMLHHFLELEKSILPIIKRNFLAYSAPVQLKLLFIMREMKFKEAVIFLEHLVLTQQGVIQYTALRSLSEINQPRTKKFS